MTTQIKSGARLLLAAFFTIGALLSSACDLEEILAVDIPGKVDAGSLNDPALAGVLVNSVVGDTECAWSNYAAAASHHSDEWIPSSGNLNMREWGQRKMGLQALSGGVLATGSCESNYGIYTPLQTARFLSNDVFDKLAEFDAGDVPDKARMQGKVRAYGGWTLLALGEGFCSMALDGGSEHSTRRGPGVGGAGLQRGNIGSRGPGPGVHVVRRESARQAGHGRLVGGNRRCAAGSRRVPLLGGPCSRPGQTTELPSSMAQRYERRH